MATTRTLEEIAQDARQLNSLQRYYKILTLEEALQKKEAEYQQLQQTMKEKQKADEDKIAKLQDTIERITKASLTKEQMLDQALLDAVTCGDMTKFQSALTLGANIKTTNSKGETALHIAALKNHLPIAEYLLQHDPALFMMRDNNHCTPIESVARQGALDALAWLYKQGKSIADFKNNMAAFDNLIQVASPKACKFLANKKLLNAAKKGNTAWVRHILEHNPMLSAKDKHGDTALHLAIKGNYHEIVKSLLAHDADPTLFNNKYNEDINSQHQSALDIAKANNNPLTPLIATHFLIHSAHHGHANNISTAISSGANLLGVDSKGQTALHKAVLNANKSTLKKLLQLHTEGNDSMDRLDQYGKTARGLAIEQHATVNTKAGNKAMSDYMMEKMGMYKARMKYSQQQSTVSTSSFALIAPTTDKNINEISNQNERYTVKMQ